MPNTNNKTKLVTLEDVTMIVNLIDATAERGALKGEELTTIGGLRDRLVNAARVLHAEAEKEAAAAALSSNTVFGIAEKIIKNDE